MNYVRALGGAASKKKLVLPKSVSTGDSALDSFLNGTDSRQYRVRWSAGDGSMAERLDRLNDAIAQLAISNGFRAMLLEPGTYKFLPHPIAPEE